jgi:glycosyltransferase involved in cell wall biosynthesis
VTRNLDARSSASRCITVILCTYNPFNRCRDFAGALESVAASQVRSSVTWEVLVVDNNSTDQVRDIVEGFCRRYPGRFRYLFEQKGGKSYALNAGVANARGEVLAFVDDDVTVDPAWLQNLTAELHDGKWAGAGGRIFPSRIFTAPSWFSVEELGAQLYGHFDLGDQPIQLNRAPFGANMAFRREMFDKYGGFRTDLGPGPNCEIPPQHEDLEFGHRLMAAGERLKYEPKAVVYHPVAPDRLKRHFFLTRSFDEGRSMVCEWGERPDVYGIPRDYLRLLRLAMAIPVMTLRGLFATHPQKRFAYKRMVWNAAGRMVELYRRSVRRRGSRGSGDKLKGSI